MRKKKKKKPNKDIQMLAKRIKFLRINQEYTSYEHFAADKEIPRTQYGRYEKGEDIRFTSLVKLADAFGITLEEFFSEGFGPGRTGRY
jgi:transcriptional regulator with XRE-family HTH domain